MEHFGPATRAWFDSVFSGPTSVQRNGWARIATGAHTLLIAPTGSGKTLAAFLSCIDRLIARQAESQASADQPGVRVLYVSPLKALAYDIERNLEAPLAGIAQAAERLGQRIVLPRVAVRTGDTTARERRLQAREPAEILVTTPESLYLLLGSQARDMLRTVDTVIVDEVHALAATKRGAHLALSLERLARLVGSGQEPGVPGTGRDPQRIGLSATARPLDAVARFLGGDREVAIVDAATRPRIDLQIIAPAADMTRPAETAALPPGVSGPASDAGEGSERQYGMWPAIYPHILALIRDHRSTIVFVNSRGLCERLTRALNELHGSELVRAHHGSLSHRERAHIEAELKAGRIAALVATSSLELGIDMGAVDLVVLVGSPASVASGLQRIGRAGHSVGQVSKGRLFPKHRGDLLEAAVVAERMAAGDIEPLHVPQNPLDVLAQQIVAMVAVEPWSEAELRATVMRTASFRDLPAHAFTGVLDMLAGRYPSTDFAELTPRIVWDRVAGVLSARRGARMVAVMSGGTIPDRGTYSVHLGEDGPRVGELDEEMVHETKRGQLITLGATTWRVDSITRDRVLVTPAPGETGKLPFWRGEGPGRPVTLGRALGAFVRELDERAAETGDAARDAARLEEAAVWLGADYALDDLAARNLIAYVRAQRQATGTVPTDRDITIERFRDELGDARVCILSPFGARVHAPWALALESRLSATAGFEVQSMWTDDGIVLRFAGPAPADAAALAIAPEEVDELVVNQLGHAALFAGQFRENAARALLLPRRRPGERTPLWVQRLRSQRLLAVARTYPDFPIVVETYRACLQDVFDLPALVELLQAIQRREIRVLVADTAGPSPFARSLMFAYVAANLYEGDAPLAERKAQALALDRNLLGELLGQDELRALLDEDVIAAVEVELQGLAEDRRAGHADALHDLLRRIGDLDAHELAARCTVDAQVLLTELRATGRVAAMRMGSRERWVAIEDVALYRDALGSPVPPGVPEALLAPVDHAMESMLIRWSRTHGPYQARELALRYDLPEAQVEALLRGLDSQQRVLHGAFRPGGSGSEWCDPEVLRRIKRRTLSRLRNQAAPVEPARLGRFLPRWHGLDQPGRGRGRLQEAIAQLEGLPLPFSELEQSILPARVSDFVPAMLDELGASGWLVWVGCGALGNRDGRIALYRRDHAAAWLSTTDAAANAPAEALAARMPAPDASGADIPAFGPVHRALLAHLRDRGASFFVALRDACAAMPTEQVMAALWDLTWAGLVTNDTFQPLRALARGTRGARKARPPRSGTRARPPRNSLDTASGRWSLVSELARSTLTPTERAHRRAIKLLERHGIVTREVAVLEPLPGGFSAVYQVLGAMEEAGQVRRGYFVTGLGGAQFAWPGAVDRLRADADLPASPEVLLLSAVDPANPYGWLLPWPEREADTRDAPDLADRNDRTPGHASPEDRMTARFPRRAAGAAILLVQGEPVLYLDKGGKSAITFPAADQRESLIAAARAVERLAARSRGKSLRIETIDGTPARASVHADTFREAGFFADPRGLVRETR